MNAVRALSPFELLREIEVRSQTQALGLPQQIEVRRTWSGIGYRMGDIRLVSPMGEIAEILEYPSLSRVPSAQPWVLGIANIRGSLLPIMDLKGFVEGENTHLSKRSRVLVIQSGELSCGLVVDEVLGLRHFFEEEKIPQMTTLDERLHAFLDGGYRQGEANWGVFSMLKLAAHPRFLEVAARS